MPTDSSTPVHWCVPDLVSVRDRAETAAGIDPDLRDRIRAALAAKVPIKFPPPPPPPDPWEWEKQLTELGIELPAIGRPNVAGLAMPAIRQIAANPKTADRSMRGFTGFTCARVPDFGR